MAETNPTIRKQRSDAELRRNGWLPISAKVHKKDKERIQAWIKAQNVLRRKLESKGRDVK